MSIFPRTICGIAVNLLCVVCLLVAIVSCPECSKVNSTCGVCELPVKGIFAWCQVHFSVQFSLFAAMACTSVGHRADGHEIGCVCRDDLHAFMFAVSLHGKGCGHGGHIDHLRDWFSDNVYCPVGCNHMCDLSALRTHQLRIDEAVTMHKVPQPLLSDDR